MTIGTFSRTPLASLAVVAVLASAGTSLAQESAATTGLAAAEQAYQDVDFATMREQATRALAAGGATREETSRLYVLDGISAAAMGQDDEAKQAFVAALAVDPTLKLDRNLSPKIRGPYLEAQGYWGAYSEHLGLIARAAADGGHLTVELVDPGHLATKVVLHVRAPGSTTYAENAADAAHVVHFPLPEDAQHRGYEYFAAALDANRNVLAELGNEGDPRVQRAALVGPALDRGGVQPPPAHQRSYLLPAVLAGAGLVAAGIGVVFHVERESAAHEWNGPHCEQPGSSRIQQCSDVDSRRRFDQAMAIGAYSAAGLLLTASVVTLLIGRPSVERPPAAARAGFVGCGVAGAGLSCAGRF
jgi:hypothetical protein